VVREEGNNNGLLERVINFVSNKLGSWWNWEVISY
jgi:hypothetical protein